MKLTSLNVKTLGRIGRVRQKRQEESIGLGFADWVRVLIADMAVFVLEEEVMFESRYYSLFDLIHTHTYFSTQHSNNACITLKQVSENVTSPLLHFRRLCSLCHPSTRLSLLGSITADGDVLGRIG
jgi:hypothetical protein